MNIGFLSFSKHCNESISFHWMFTQEPFTVNFNANLKLFLRLSNCTSVGEKYCGDYQDAWNVREKKEKEK